MIKGERGVSSNSSNLSQDTDMREGSFLLQYDADEDCLDVSFDLTGGVQERILNLNDFIQLKTNYPCTRLLGLTFFNYTQLLEANETDFSEMEENEPFLYDAAMNLISQYPGYLFFELTDPNTGVARIEIPDVSRLIGG